MDLFWGRRSMHTLRKLPTASPRRANKNTPSISTGAYCGRIMALKSIVNRYYCQAQLLLSLWGTFLLSLRVPIYRDVAISLQEKS